MGQERRQIVYLIFGLHELRNGCVRLKVFMKQISVNFNSGDTAADFGARLAPNWLHLVLFLHVFYDRPWSVLNHHSRRSG
jgi:hypothetical protein